MNEHASEAAHDRQASCALFSRLPLELRLQTYKLVVGDRILYIDHQYDLTLRREKPCYHLMGSGSSMSDWKVVYDSEDCFAESSIWPELSPVSAHVEVVDRRQRCGFVSLLLCCKAM